MPGGALSLPVAHYLRRCLTIVLWRDFNLWLVHWWKLRLRSDATIFRHHILPIILTTTRHPPSSPLNKTNLPFTQPSGSKMEDGWPDNSYMDKWANCGGRRGCGEADNIANKWNYRGRNEECENCLPWRTIRYIWNTDKVSQWGQICRMPRRETSLVHVVM